MLDIKLIRENPDLVKKNQKKKDRSESEVDEVLRLDKAWRELKEQADSLRSKRNKISQDINKAKKEGKNADSLMVEAKEIPLLLEKTEKLMVEAEEKRDIALRKLPNLMSDKVPKGKSGEDNVEIRKGGVIPKFDFQPKSHVELAEKNDLADFDASARVSGNGFYYLKNDLALLNQALIRFTVDFMYNKDYSYIEPPLMLHEKEIFASMDKGAIEQSVYSIKGEDLNLIGTSEQSVLAMHSDQTINEWELPKKYFAYSMCFRKEVGAHGINEKGLWRTHQFNKVEQFIFCKPEESEKMYEELMNNSEEILKALKLPYRAIEICTGDLADWKFRSADFEVWRPTTNSYGEVMSLSNCTDYQARKLGIKCLDKQGNKRVIHTLNDTALATSRILVTILENNQQKDGTIKIPEVLIPYMHGKKVIGKGKDSPKEDKQIPNTKKDNKEANTKEKKAKK